MVTHLTQRLYYNNYYYFIIKSTSTKLKTTYKFLFGYIKGYMSWDITPVKVEITFLQLSSFRGYSSLRNLSVIMIITSPQVSSGASWSLMSNARADTNSQKRRRNREKTCGPRISAGAMSWRAAVRLTQVSLRRTSFVPRLNSPHPKRKNWTP